MGIKSIYGLKQPQKGKKWVLTPYGNLKLIPIGYKQILTPDGHIKLTPTIPITPILPTKKLTKHK